MFLGEFAYIAVALMIGITIYWCIIVPFFGMYSVTRILFMNLNMCLGCYAYCYISTCWVINMYGKQKKYYEQFAKDTVENKEHRNMTLEEILSAKDGFDLLADHLVKEFCIESLLFLFEMMQIKDQLITTKLNVIYIQNYIFHAISTYVSINYQFIG